MKINRNSSINIWIMPNRSHSVMQKHFSYFDLAEVKLFVEILVNVCDKVLSLSIATDWLCFCEAHMLKSSQCDSGNAWSFGKAFRAHGLSSLWIWWVLFYSRFFDFFLPFLPCEVVARASNLDAHEGMYWLDIGL